jgi:hypothetical protein
LEEIYNNKLVLEKYPGKGGWIFVILEGLPKQPKSGKGNWAKAHGSIDDYVLGEITLWPMPNGKVFMPVKAAIRKVIKKEEGDTVHVILYGKSPEPQVQINDFLASLACDPLAQKTYNNLSPNAQKQVIGYIFEKDDTDTQIDRMTHCLKDLAKGFVPNI